jgi:bloom syndrome protein
MINYCENKVECRRKIILNYFGEEFNSKNCNCDNCLSKINDDFEEIDYSNEAKNIIQLIKNYPEGIFFNKK